eukprot:GHVS01002955.1.p1 GENE.GHVS01002955.1~~GHVS01002955.1.p1  ORF type:complete len:1863 (+),score=228.34 GHVS01002955.1:131-5719(+)
MTEPTSTASPPLPPSVWWWPFPQPSVPSTPEVHSALTSPQADATTDESETPMEESKGGEGCVLDYVYPQWLLRGGFVGLSRRLLLIVDPHASRVLSNEEITEWKNGESVDAGETIPVSTNNIAIDRRRVRIQAPYPRHRGSSRTEIASNDVPYSESSPSLSEPCLSSQLLSPTPVPPSLLTTNTRRSRRPSLGDTTSDIMPPLIGVFEVGSKLDNHCYYHFCDGRHQRSWATRSMIAAESRECREKDGAEKSETSQLVEPSLVATPSSEPSTGVSELIPQVPIRSDCFNYRTNSIPSDFTVVSSTCPYPLSSFVTPLSSPTNSPWNSPNVDFSSAQPCLHPLSNSPSAATRASLPVRFFSVSPSALNQSDPTICAPLELPSAATSCNTVSDDGRGIGAVGEAAATEDRWDCLCGSLCGELYNRYVIEELVGRGSHGAVFRSRLIYSRPSRCLRSASTRTVPRSSSNSGTGILRPAERQLSTGGRHNRCDSMQSCLSRDERSSVDRPNSARQVSTEGDAVDDETTRDMKELNGYGREEQRLSISIVDTEKRLMLPGPPVRTSSTTVATSTLPLESVGLLPNPSPNCSGTPSSERQPTDMFDDASDDGTPQGGTVGDVDLIRDLSEAALEAAAAALEGLAEETGECQPADIEISGGTKYPVVAAPESVGETEPGEDSCPPDRYSAADGSLQRNAATSKPVTTSTWSGVGPEGQSRVVRRRSSTICAVGKKGAEDNRRDASLNSRSLAGSSANCITPVCPYSHHRTSRPMLRDPCVGVSSLQPGVPEGAKEFTVPVASTVAIKVIDLKSAYRASFKYSANLRGKPIGGTSAVPSTPSWSKAQAASTSPDYLPSVGASRDRPAASCHSSVGCTVSEGADDLGDFEYFVGCVMQELLVLKYSDHPNVLRLYEYFLWPPAYLVVVTEYLKGGSLRDLYKSCGPLSESTAAILLHDVCCGLHYLHTRWSDQAGAEAGSNGLSIVHRDIKAENILLSDTGVAKIADLGVCVVLLKEQKAYEFVGTPQWMAPEVAAFYFSHRGPHSSTTSPGASRSREKSLTAPQPGRRRPRRSSTVSNLSHLPADAGTWAAELGGMEPLAIVDAQLCGGASCDRSGDGSRRSSSEEAQSDVGYGVSADVWSLGITAYELVLGRLPWRKSLTMEQLMSKIVYGRPPKVNLSQGIDRHFCYFVERCLQRNPSSRSTTEDLLNHELFKKLGKSLQNVPFATVEELRELTLKHNERRRATRAGGSILMQIFHKIPLFNAPSKHDGRSKSSTLIKETGSPKALTPPEIDNTDASAVVSAVPSSLPVMRSASHNVFEFFKQVSFTSSATANPAASATSSIVRAATSAVPSRLFPSFFLSMKSPFSRSTCESGTSWKPAATPAIPRKAAPSGSSAFSVFSSTTLRRRSGPASSRCLPYISDATGLRPSATTPLQPSPVSKSGSHPYVPGLFADNDNRSPARSRALSWSSESRSRGLPWSFPSRRRSVCLTAEDTSSPQLGNACQSRQHEGKCDQANESEQIVPQEPTAMTGPNHSPSFSYVPHLISQFFQSPLLAAAKGAPSDRNHNDCDKFSEEVVSQEVAAMRSHMKLPVEEQDNNAQSTPSLRITHCRQQEYSTGAEDVITEALSLSPRSHMPNSEPVGNTADHHVYMKRLRSTPVKTPHSSRLRVSKSGGELWHTCDSDGLSPLVNALVETYCSSTVYKSGFTCGHLGGRRPSRLFPSSEGEMAFSPPIGATEEEASVIYQLSAGDTIAEVQDVVEYQAASNDVTESGTPCNITRESPSLSPPNPPTCQAFAAVDENDKLRLSPGDKGEGSVLPIASEGSLLVDVSREDLHPEVSGNLDSPQTMNFRLLLESPCYDNTHHAAS